MRSSTHPFRLGHAAVPAGAGRSVASALRQTTNAALVALVLAAGATGDPQAQAAPPSGTGGAAAAPAASSAPSTAPGGELAWPRQFDASGATITVYQPQIDSWNGTDFKAKAAVQVTSGNLDQFGTIAVAGRADVDKAARVVTIHDVVLGPANFPTAPDKQAAWLAAIQAHAGPSRTIQMSLDHAEATMAMSQDVRRAMTVDVRNVPPRIIVSTKPAILVSIDGPPNLQPTPGDPSVMRVVNTRSFVAQQVGGPFFLKAAGQWFTSPGLDGQWTTSSGVPVSIEAACSAAIAQKLVDPMDPTAGAAVPAGLTVDVSTTPAELIAIDGQPQFLPIEGTNLLEVQNTSSPLFRELSDNSVYVLISGRWFRAPSFDGPWTFVDPSSLPADFAKIPSDHPRSNVLVSVPGTPQAREAVIATTIPQTATVSRAQTKLTVQYDGAPAFAPIASTPLQYAQNSATPVIEVSPTSFFAVQNGVWFSAPAASGPWVVATEVPEVIYTIPASSPMHYVTYVRVYGSTPDAVYVGYTPGYMGVCVAPGGVVVYGTGYAYPAYVGTVYYPPPPTYGYGAAFACGALTGFAFGYAAGAAWGGCCAPYWGPCGWANYSHVNINTTNVYGHWGGAATVTHGYGYNSWTGTEWSGTRGASYNPYNGRTSAAAGGRAYNPYTGNWAAGERGATFNPSTGVAAAGARGATGNTGSGTVNTAGHGAVYNTNTDNGVGWNKNNVYVDKDGNVNQYDRNQGWQQRSGDGWTASNPAHAASLNQEAVGRSVGENRYQGYRGGGGAYRGGGFQGGGFRGGGRR